MAIRLICNWFYLTKNLLIGVGLKSMVVWQKTFMKQINLYRRVPQFEKKYNQA